MKVAVIGAGYWGKKHIEEYVALGHEVTVYDSDPELRKKYNSFTYEEIISNPEIQVVSVCTPNHTHHKIAKDMLCAKKNVLVEKPMAMSAHEAVDLITCSKINKSVLSVGHLYRFNNAINEVKRILTELGDIRQIKFVWINTEPKFIGRDILYDLAPHPFDIINFLLSKNPKIVSCIGEGFRTPEIEMAQINGFVDKTLINIELSWLTPPKTRTMTIVGSLKSLVVDCVDQVIMEYGYDNISHRLKVKPNNTIRDELQAFIGCVENRELPNIADGIAGLNTIKAIEQCYQNQKR